MANLLINGSLCLTDLIQHAKAGHSAFSKGKNGKIYFNFTEWVNDEPNQYGQHSSYQLNSSKEKKAEDLQMFGKCYIGNGKKSEGGAGEHITAADVDELGEVEIPSADPTPVDDLPF